MRVVFESCKKGDNTYINKEVEDKRTNALWSLDNLARAFRELYSHLNWVKVFEALDTINPAHHMFDPEFIDKKAFQTFLSLYNKTKPQNIQFPINSLIGKRWKNYHTQMSILDYALQIAAEKECIPLEKGQNKLGIIDNLHGIKANMQPWIKIWTNIDFVQCLVDLSRTKYYFRIK
jgi:hypothetical protein